MGWGCKILILWGSMKNPIFRGVHKVEGGLPKRGAWGVCRFKRGLGKKQGGWCFQGGLIPQCTVCINIKTNKFLSGLNTSKDPSLDGISSKFLQDGEKSLTT